MSDKWRKLITSYVQKKSSQANYPSKKVIRNGKIVTISAPNEKLPSNAIELPPNEPKIPSFAEKFSKTSDCQNSKSKQNKINPMRDSSKLTSKNTSFPFQQKNLQSEGRIQKNSECGGERQTDEMVSQNMKAFDSSQNQVFYNVQRANQLPARFCDKNRPENAFEESFSSDDLLSDPNIDKNPASNKKNLPSFSNGNEKNCKDNKNKTTSSSSVTAKYIENLINRRSVEKSQHDLLSLSANSRNSNSLESNTTTPISNSNCSTIVNAPQSETKDISENVQSLSKTENSKNLSASISQIQEKAKPAVNPRILVKMAPPGVVIVSPSSKMLCDILGTFPNTFVRYNPKTGEWLIDPQKYTEIRLVLKKSFRFQDIPPSLLKLYLQFSKNNVSSFEHLNTDFITQTQNRAFKNVVTRENSSMTTLDKKSTGVKDQTDSLSSSKNQGEKKGETGLIQSRNGLKLQKKSQDTRSFKNPFHIRSIFEDEFKNFPTFQDLKVPLLKFQRTAVTQAIAWGGRILLADEMGLGKTLQALASALHYRAEWPCLVLSPASLVGSWVKSFSDFANIEACILKEKTVYSEKAYICSYDMAAKIFRNSTTTFRVIIADEAHFLKNPKTTRCASLLSMLQSANRLFLLSGTPATSRPCELYTSLIALRPKAFKCFKEFGERYCGGIQKNRYADWRGCSNSEELLFFLQNIFMIRRTKADVLSELPRKSRVQVILEISREKNSQVEFSSQQSNDSQKITPELQSNLLRYISDTFKDPKKLPKVDKLDKNIIQMYNEAAERKIPSVIRYIRKILKRNQKTVVFAQHHIMLNEIQKSIENIKHIRIDGKTPVHTRQRLVENFQNDPEIQIALLSITTCGTGLTLTAATTAIFTELYWNPGTLLQAEDRIHRIGQTKEVTIYYLTATHTVDEVVWPLLTKKMAVLEKCGVGNNEFKDIQSDDISTKITEFCTVEKYTMNNDS